VPRFDENLTPEQWRLSEERDAAEQEKRDEFNARFREDALEVLEAAFRLRAVPGLRGDR